MARVVLLLLVLSVIAAAVRSIARHIWAALAPPGAPEPTDAEALERGAFLHRVVTDAYAAEREGWARDRVARVEARLQAGRPADRRLQVEILWIPEVNAFIAPGRWIYVSRRLLERCRTTTRWPC